MYSKKICLIGHTWDSRNRVIFEAFETVADAEQWLKENTNYGPIIRGTMEFRSFTIEERYTPLSVTKVVRKPEPEPEPELLSPPLYNFKKVYNVHVVDGNNRMFQVGSYDTHDEACEGIKSEVRHKTVLITTEPLTVFHVTVKPSSINGYHAYVVIPDFKLF